ncbi:MAG: hypothetical protein AAB413_04110 [Patescibacteria group bacterium]
MRLIPVLLALLLSTPTFALAQQLTATATVEIYHGDTVWMPGRPLAVCVQTGLRASGLSGKYRIEYRFAYRSSEGATRSTLPELQFVWADTSFMLVDANNNLVALASGRVRGQDKDQVLSRAVDGDGLLPGVGEFTRICGDLTGKTIVFTHREHDK